MEKIDGPSAEKWRHTFTTRRLTSGNTKNLSGHTDGSLNLEVLIGSELLEGVRD